MVVWRWFSPRIADGGDHGGPDAEVNGKVGAEAAKPEEGPEGRYGVQIAHREQPFEIDHPENEATEPTGPEAVAFSFRIAASQPEREHERECPAPHESWIQLEAGEAGRQHDGTEYGAGERPEGVGTFHGKNG